MPRAREYLPLGKVPLWASVTTRLLCSLGALLLAVGVAACQPNGEGSEPTLVVENGRVIVGDGPVLEEASVVVAGDSILSVTQDLVDAPNARVLTKRQTPVTTTVSRPLNFGE